MSSLFTHYRDGTEVPSTREQLRQDRIEMTLAAVLVLGALSAIAFAVARVVVTG